MTETNETPRPQPDRDSEPFWQAIQAGELRLQKCGGCEVLRWPPRAICNRCFDFDASWQRVEPRGVVVSWVRTHQAFAEAYRDKVPYLVVQVALEEQRDIMLIGGWQGDRDPVAGEQVQACFVTVDADLTLLDWTPVA